MIKKSLALRVLAISFILLALPLLIDSFIQFQRSYEDSLKDAEQNLISVSLQRVPSISELTAAKIELLNEVELLIDFPKLLETLPNPSLNSTLRLLADSSGFTEMAFLKKTEDNKYVPVASSNPNAIGQDYTNAIDFDQLAAKGSYIYPNYEDITLDKTFNIGKKINDSDGNQLGILMVTISLSDKLQRRLKPGMGKYPIDFALLTEDSIVFAASDPTLELQYFQPLSKERKEAIAKSQQFGELPLPEKPLRTFRRTDFPFLEFSWNGVTQLAYQEQVFNSQLTLLAYAEKETIFNTKFWELVKNYAIYAITLLVGGGITYWFTLRMAKPLKNLSQIMSSVQKGNYQSRYKKDPLGFEINALGSIFNQMIDSLLHQMRQAENERVKRETITQELKIGQDVQRSLLPQEMPKYPGVEIAEVYIPAKLVGGDFYDVYVKKEIATENDVLVLTVADASGKGISACLYSLGVRSMLRTYATDYDDVARILSMTNKLFCQDTGDTGMFITVLQGIYNARTNKLSYFSCGHNPGIIRRANGSIVTLAHSGMAMGLLEFRDVYADTVDLHSGDVLIFYTDGITEAHNLKNQLFTEDRLLNCLKRRNWVSANDFAKGIVKEVEEFVGAAPQHDDITILVMKVL